MRRRVVLAALAAALAPGLPAAQAQQRAGMRRLGVLVGNFAKDGEGQAPAAALLGGLRALGWTEGGNLAIDWRWAGGSAALSAQYAAELVSLGSDVLVATSTVALDAMRRQATTIPIVFVQVTDPVGQGVVPSMAHPGGTITGFSVYDPPMAGKWLELLTQVTPPVARVAVLYNLATAPYAGLMLRAIEKAASSLAVAVRAAPVNDDAGIEATMTALAREERGGLLVLPDGLTVAHRDKIIALAARHRLPAIYSHRFFAADGGLMSYGIEAQDPFRRAADYVDRILKGQKPGDLPVQEPIKFELVINLKTAQALGITIPTTLLATADEVIE